MELIGLVATAVFTPLALLALRAARARSHAPAPAAAIRARGLRAQAALRTAAAEQSRAGPRGRRVERFRQEAQLSARLAHPNIVAVLDSGDDPRGYIVMELSTARTPADCCARRTR
jgi:serine/threonine protein kinase